jgi:hypothetical protein
VQAGEGMCRYGSTPKQGSLSVACAMGILSKWCLTFDLPTIRQQKGCVFSSWSFFWGLCARSPHTDLESEARVEL